MAMAVVAALVAGAPVSRAPVSRAPAEGVPKGAGDGIPAEWRKRTTLRVLPGRPRQNSNVRLLGHCPTTADHAIIGSTAFNLKGSRRLYREVGASPSDRGLFRRSVSISYFALPGDHEVRMTCVNVTMNQKTRIRKIDVISRCSVPLEVRRFRIAQFFW
ncbi:hypothetical protein [Nonomuraea sp. NPDC002799]